MSSYDDSLYCLKRTNGEVIWKVQGGSHRGVALDHEKIYYSLPGKVVALDKGSGKELWAYKLIGNTLPTRPVLYNGLLIFGESEGQLKVLSSKDGVELGKYAPGHGLLSTPFVDKQKNEIYFISVSANLFALSISWKPYSDYWPWEKAPR